ncbi:MAG TPA: 6-carboxytetrahydropterin synthase [Levilinea sp.]|nr:6-carboxytetrahydropterin synthase [Levilinea sp.]
MYRVAVQRDFFARHYLIGGDYGTENDHHSHHWVLELELEGQKLNREGFLVDMFDLDENLDQRVAVYEEQTLNDLKLFAGVNPSPENFARILCEELANEIYADHISKITVKLWQDDSTWASYSIER